MLYPIRRPALLLMAFALLATPLCAAERAAVDKRREPFLRSLNALQFRTLHGKIRSVPFQGAIRFLGEAFGVKIKLHPEVTRSLSAREAEWKTLSALRDRLRFFAENLTVTGAHARAVLSDFARRHGFRIEFAPGAFVGSEDAIPPSAYAKVQKALALKPVRLHATAADLATLLLVLRKAGGIPLSVDAEVPAWVRKRRVHVSTSTLPLGEALGIVAREFGLAIGWRNGGIVLFSGTPPPPPWAAPQGFWLQFRSIGSAEKGLRTALGSCRPKLALRLLRGRWVVERAGKGPVLPWDDSQAIVVSESLGGRTPLDILRSLAKRQGFVLGFPDGLPVLLPRRRTRPDLPLTERTYRISFLKGSYEDFPGRFPDPGRKRGHGAAPVMFEESEEERLNAEQMRQNVLEYARDGLLCSGISDGDHCWASLSGGLLKMRTTPDVHEKVANFLHQLRRLHRRAVQVSFHFLHVNHSLMGDLIESGKLAAGALTPAQLKLIKKGLADKRATSVKRASLIAFNAQKVNASAVKQKTYICDFDVEVAQGAQIGDPIVASVREGMVVEVTPVVFADTGHILLDLRTAVAKVLEPIQAFETPHGSVSLPKVDFQRISTSLFIRDGGAVLLGGAGDLGIGKNLVLLVRASILAEPHDDPFAATSYHDLQARVFDISDLMYEVPQWPGPNVGITVGDEEDGMGPAFMMDGDDPRVGERYEYDEIEELVRSRVAPKSWDTPPNSIASVLGYLVVVNRRRAVKEVASLLAQCRSRRMKALEVVTRFLSVDSQALAGILTARDDAAKHGAALTPDQVRSIIGLAKAGKGKMLSSSTFSLLNKQRASIQTGRTVPYIRDVDVEVAQMVSVSDPVTGHLLEGVFLDYKAEFDPDEDEVTLEIRPTIAHLRKMVVAKIGVSRKKEKENGKDDGDRRAFDERVRIMLPELDLQKIRTTLTLRNGATSLVFCPAEAGGETNRDLVILVTVKTTAVGGK